jgi:hypothetical protein
LGSQATISACASRSSVLVGAGGGHQLLDVAPGQQFQVLRQMATATVARRRAGQCAAAAAGTPTGWRAPTPGGLQALQPLQRAAQPVISSSRASRVVAVDVEHLGASRSAISSSGSAR